METLPIFNISYWFIIKIFVLIALGLYSVFAFVVVKQMRIMTQTLEVGYETLLNLVAYLHLFYAIGLLLLALLIL